MYAYLVLRIYFLYYLLLPCYLVVYCVAPSLIPPHKSSLLRDPTAQTTEGVIHSAEPLFLSSSGLTPQGVATAWAHKHTGCLIPPCNVEFHLYKTPAWIWLLMSKCFLSLNLKKKLMRFTLECTRSFQSYTRYEM